MQLADIVSVAKMKMIYAYVQSAHTQAYDAAMHLPGDQWQCLF